MSKNSGYLLNRIIESLFSNTEPILNNIGRQISKLENEVFSKEPDGKIVKELAIHRRNILNFRRIVDPQRYLVSNLTHTRKPFLDESLTLYFDNVNDYLAKIWSIIETYKDTIEGLHVTVESLLTRRTNKVVATLTAISVALLPLTLLSGLYGMNIDNLPLARNPIYVWLMFLSLTTAILVILIIMKKKRLL
jgi:magnesium transporter